MRDRVFTKSEITHRTDQSIGWVKEHRKLNGIMGMTTQESLKYEGKEFVLHKRIKMSTMMSGKYDEDN